MRKKSLIRTSMLLGAIACGLLIGNGKSADAASGEVPTIIGESKVIYQNSTDKIAVQGKRIVSVKYTSSKKKVATVSKKGVIKGRKKGTTTIKVKVIYRKKTGGKKYTKNLSYKLQVYGKVKEYFKYDGDASNSVILSLTSKGKKLKKVYLPETIESSKVVSIANTFFAESPKMTEVYMGDYLDGVYRNKINAENKLKKISLGRDYSYYSEFDDFFRNCSSLEKIEVDSRNKVFRVEDGVLFGKNTLVCYPAKKSGSAYKIPDSVTNVGNSAFANCKNLKSITVPDNVDSFDDYCFAGSGLVSMEFSDEIYRLSDGMFKDCASLKDVRLSKRMASIPSCAFSNCDSLKSFTVESGVERIEGTAFEGCDQLVEFKASDANKKLKAVDGVLYSKDGKSVMLYPGGRKDATYEIKSGVTTIDDEAFYACKSLQKVVIPNTVTRIEYSAFRKSGLTNIDLPNSVIKIEDQAFEDCTKLSDVKLPDNLTELEWGVFRDCIGLTKITLSKEVTDFAKDTFDGCRNLSNIEVDDNNTTFSSVDGILYSKSKESLYLYPAGKKDSSFTIPKTVRTIKSYAFIGVVNLKKISVPNEVNKIYYDAFFKAKSVQIIELPKTMKKTSGLSFERCSSLKKITIPKGYEEIPYDAFSDCSSLEEVVVPDSVTRIDSEAFSGCAKLKKVTIGKGLKYIGYKAFSECVKLKNLTINSTHIKLSSIRNDAFRKAGASNYKKFVVKVPKSKKKVYRKYFCKKGLSKKVVFK